MGSGSSKIDGERSDTSSNHSAEIDLQIQKHRAELCRTVKLLLLGTGECGKSTVLKQMRILHSNGFTDAEIEIQKSIVHENVMTGIVSILRAMPQLDIDFENLSLQKIAIDVIDCNDASKSCSTNLYDKQFLTIELVTAIKCLWQDAGVLRCYAKGFQFQLPDSTKYFLDSIDRIGNPWYVPTQDDILRSRAQTTNIVEVSFGIKDSIFRVYDVGGQRSSRPKWIHWFDNVRAIIFIVAISEYDMMLREDGKTNRLLESLALFESICSTRWLSRASIILFLNKKDLFEEKIKDKSINVAFPHYNGLQSYEECLDYISEQFDSKKSPVDRIIFEHVTCATDTTQMQFVLDSVTETIFKGNFNALGFTGK